MVLTSCIYYLLEINKSKIHVPLKKTINSALINKRNIKNITRYEHKFENKLLYIIRNIIIPQLSLENINTFRVPYINWYSVPHLGSHKRN